MLQMESEFGGGAEILGLLPSVRALFLATNDTLENTFSSFLRLTLSLIFLLCALL